MGNFNPFQPSNTDTELLQVASQPIYYLHLGHSCGGEVDFYPRSSPLGFHWVVAGFIVIVEDPVWCVRECVWACFNWSDLYAKICRRVSWNVQNREIRIWHICVYIILDLYAFRQRYSWFKSFREIWKSVVLKLFILPSLYWEAIVKHISSIPTRMCNDPMPFYILCTPKIE